MKLRRIFLFFLTFSLCMHAELLAASADLCANAARKAEEKHAIPEGLLQAISLIETGRTVNKQHAAWPWTTNTQGNGAYFANRKDAERFVRRMQRKGVKSIDIGCFQINTRWHREAFGRVSDMFSPTKSADYAARFLVSLKEQRGGWEKAVAAYHSRAPKRGGAYAQRVMAAFKKTKADAVTTAAALKQTTPQRANSAVQAPAGVALTLFTDREPLFSADARAIVGVE